MTKMLEAAKEKKQTTGLRNNFLFVFQRSKDGLLLFCKGNKNTWVGERVYRGKM